MDTFERELRNVQRRDWQIWILMLTVFLILTTFVVLVIFYSDLQRLYEEQMDVRMFNFLLLGFVALSLLFIGYVVLKEAALKKLQRDLVENEVGSRDLERSVAEFQTVQELTNLVNSEMTLSDVFDTITSKALATLGGDQCSLFLYDPEIDKLRCVSVWGPKSDCVKEAIVEVGKSVAGWVIEHRKPLFLDGDLKEDQFREFVRKDKRITSGLCLPLMVRREPRGVLSISIFEKKRRFAESDLKLASKFAEHAASAIDKAGLYEKLREQTKTLKNIIKEMKATQDRFTQPDTLRALSDLTSRMAHDFDNTLATILEKTQLAQKKLEGMPIPEKTKMQDVLEWLRATERLAGDGVETARNVQAFAKTFQVGSEKDSEELDINAIVDETVEATRHRWKDGAELDGIRIKMETHLGELSSPMGNRSDMKDVLTSMLFNSIDALPQGGRICIATRMHRDRVEIKVTDNGVGMSQDVKTKIFEPFFTTKTEEGHGIGLSVAQGIISRQHGDMSVESKPGAGTSFTITLPIKDESTVEPERPAESVNRSEAATPAT